MQESPERIEETLEWLRFADRDLKAAELLLSPGNSILENGLFCCQQAVENWLKALLILHGFSFPKIHDLGKLGALCIMIDSDLRELVESAAGLTDFATVYRCPGSDPVIDDCDGGEWLALTRRVRDAVLGKMPREVRDALPAAA
jgi:HEPN domain-containing protein